MHELREIHSGPRSAAKVHRQQVVHLHIEGKIREHVVLKWNNSAGLIPLARDLQMILDDVVAVGFIAPHHAGRHQRSDYGNRSKWNDDEPKPAPARSFDGRAVTRFSNRSPE